MVIALHLLSLGDRLIACSPAFPWQCHAYDENPKNGSFPYYNGKSAPLGDLFSDKWASTDNFTLKFNR